MCKIGILSDTHGLIRSEVINALNGCDSIIHAGDIDRSGVIEALREIAPVYAVRGNADKDEWADDLPKSLSITLNGIRIYAIHNKKHIAEDLSDKNVVIYGHTHKYHKESHQGYQIREVCGRNSRNLRYQQWTGRSDLPYVPHSSGNRHGRHDQKAGRKNVITSSSLTFTFSQAADCRNDRQIYRGQDYIEQYINLQKAV